MRGSFDASLEDPWPDRSPDGYRVTHNILRYHQIGVASGWVEVDGSRVEIERRQDLPQTGETERHYLTHKQLLELARATGRFETLTLILGYCGLRFGEPAALRRKDVGNREITVRSSATYVARQGILEAGIETNRTRDVPVPEPIWNQFEKQLPEDGDALVFPSRKGGHLPNHEYRRVFNKACEEVGIKGLVPRGLRHTQHP